VSDFIETIQKEWAVISGAPWSFATVIVAVGVILWLFVNQINSGTISAKDATIETLKIQNESYKQKLNGASPEEAKARMDALEARVSRVEPRRLSHEQKKTIAENATLPAGTSYALSIESDKRCPDCTQYADEFSDIFSEAHWAISTPTVERPSTKSSKGIAVLSPDPNSPLPAAAALIHALKAANVPFDLMPGSDLNFSLQGIPAPIPAMLITSKVTS
jgi:hypothetical protein